MTIGERVKKRRIELGLSVDKLAEQLNINRATIYRYESNHIENMPTTILEPLAAALKTTPSYLMGWTDKQEVKPNCNWIILNEKETNLIENFRNLTPEMQDFILETIKNLTSAQKK